MNKDFIGDWPEEVMAQKYKDQALPIEFHWITEKGEPAQLTSGMRLLATVGTYAQGSTSRLTIVGLIRDVPQAGHCPHWSSLCWLHPG